MRDRGRSQRREQIVPDDTMDWSKDPDWDCIILNPEPHRWHHGYTDRYGNLVCRECSRARLVMVPMRFARVADRVPESGL